MHRHVATHAVLILLVISLLPLLQPVARGAGDAPASVEEMLNSPRDLWGEAALKQPNGASYEFFAPLLQPLRYCDAPFRHYPITLSAPGVAAKARFISNGSAINALARQPNWVGETGTPVSFRVTRELVPFGEDLLRLDGPHYEQGYLPIVQLRYRVGKQVFAEECFAPVDPDLAKHGVALVRFTLVDGPQGEEGKVEAQVESETVLTAKEGVFSDKDGKTLVAYEPDRWGYRPGRCTLLANLQPGQSAHLAVYTHAGDAPVKVDAAFYDEQRKRCIESCNEVLGRGMQVQTPEAVVNNAWRAATIGSFMLLSGNRIWYSQGNQYGKLYIGEGGDATRAMAEYGQLDTARKIIPPLFAYTRQGLEFHQAALKLQMLAHFYWLTRDAEFVKSMRVVSNEGRKPGWQTELDLLLTGREAKSGLFPPEKYAGDIADKVYSLNSNSNGWRGLRDMAVVLDEIGEKELAKKAAASAEQFRMAVMAALEKSIDRNVQPPFVPVALFGAEKPYDNIVGHRLGSYWNIMSKFVLASGVFPATSEYADALIDYARQRGGLCMGMNRNFAEPDSWWVDPRGINDLYTLRYTNTLLKRDDVDHALVNFYGKLAHGFTRDTFIGCEGSSILPINGNGRQMYLPPNSAANANFLEPLRQLLVQDFDANDDGRPETLRLCFATPRAWMKDGGEIKVERAPTAFGDVSFDMRSAIASGKITADVSLPERPPAKTLLRIRVPDGFVVKGATIGGTDVTVESSANGATMDLTKMTGKVQIIASVERKPAK